MNDDMKYGYNVCGQRLNEEIDTMIDEVHNAYMNNTDENTRSNALAPIPVFVNLS